MNKDDLKAILILMILAGITMICFGIIFYYVGEIARSL